MTDELGSLRDQIDRISSLTDAGEVYEARRETGEVGEAIGAVFRVEVAGEELVHQHAPDTDPHGLDQVTLDPNSGELIGTEYKAIGPESSSHRPGNSLTKDGRQMDDPWTIAGLERLDISVGDDEAPLNKELIQVDLGAGTLALYDVASDGTLDKHAAETWSVDDILDVADAIDAADQADEASDASDPASGAIDSDADASGDGAGLW